jgi:mono/diheme cytochrome c family protein
MRSILAGALALGFTASAGAQTPAYDPRQENIEELPAGHGREETFGLCTACHGFRLVSSQGMSRVQWDETLT